MIRDRTTKAQLRATIEGLSERVRALGETANRLQAERDSARRESDFRGRCYEGLKAAEEATGVTVYVANRSVGTPTCIYANGTTPDDDLAVALYLDSGRNLVGVVVTDGSGEDVAGAGMVPYGDRDETI